MITVTIRVTSPNVPDDSIEVTITREQFPRGMGAGVTAELIKDAAAEAVARARPARR